MSENPTEMMTVQIPRSPGTTGGRIECRVADVGDLCFDHGEWYPSSIRTACRHLVFVPDPEPTDAEMLGFIFAHVAGFRYEPLTAIEYGFRCRDEDGDTQHGYGTTPKAALIALMRACGWKPKENP